MQTPGGLEFVVIMLLPILLWGWTLIDVLKNDFKDSGKIVWLLVIFFLNIFGSILYLLIGRKQRIIQDKR